MKSCMYMYSTMSDLCRCVLYCTKLKAIDAESRVVLLRWVKFCIHLIPKCAHCGAKHQASYCIQMLEQQSSELSSTRRGQVQNPEIKKIGNIPKITNVDSIT